MAGWVGFVGLAAHEPIGSSIYQPQLFKLVFPCFSFCPLAHFVAWEPNSGTNGGKKTNI